MGTSGFRDGRLQARLQKLSDRFEEAPGLSFPQMFQEPGDLEACYRFFSNVNVTTDAILSEHYDALTQSARVADEVIVVHDTTHFFFGVDSNRRGLGRMRKSNNTFFAHASLVLASTGYRRPLGIAAIQTYIRTDEAADEYARWGNGVEMARRRLNAVPAIHVMDREADDYTLICQLLEQGEHFVIRSSHDRALVNDERGPKLRQATQNVERRVHRDVGINARLDGERPPDTKKKHPVREARMAQLAIGATTVELKRPDYKSKSASARGRRPESVQVNVVRVWEPEPPQGEPPIEWRLLTTEPIASIHDIERIVDLYRTRWTIEEYFKALKTGCAIEKRQLLDYESLCNALAIFIPIACRALALRSAAHETPDEASSLELDVDELAVLRLKKAKLLGASPSARDVLRAVASLGGHIKYNGDPGWITILRGMQSLLSLTEGWRLAKLQYARDQS